MLSKTRCDRRQSDIKRRGIATRLHAHPQYGRLFSVDWVGNRKRPRSICAWFSVCLSRGGFVGREARLQLWGPDEHTNIPNTVSKTKPLQGGSEIRIGMRPKKPWACLKNFQVVVEKLSLKDKFVIPCGVVGSKLQEDTCRPQDLCDCRRLQGQGRAGGVDRFDNVA